MRPSVKVWDLPTRLMHWGLALGCALAWLSTEIFQGWHERVGYATLALVVLRVFWGLVGSHYAKFAQFVRGPRATMKYARLAWLGRAPRYLGHNPLGAWMALALWICLAALGITGWLYTTDMFWGEAWLDVTHRLLAWSLLALAVLHVVGVVHTGARTSDPLISSMVTGSKSPPCGNDVA